MFFNQDSGLYLTQYRAYDPASGRWLTRDPIVDETKRPEPLAVNTGEDNAVHNLAADVPAWSQPLPSARSGFLLTYSLDTIKQRNPVLTNGTRGASWPNALNLYGYAWQNPVGQKDSTGLCASPPQAPDGTPIDPAGCVGNFIRACGILIGILGGNASGSLQAIGNEPPRYRAGGGGSGQTTTGSKDPTK
jgi:hypothetical protein